MCTEPQQRATSFSSTADSTAVSSTVRPTEILTSSVPERSERIYPSSVSKSRVILPLTITWYCRGTSDQNSFQENVPRSNAGQSSSFRFPKLKLLGHRDNG